MVLQPFSYQGSKKKIFDYLFFFSFFNYIIKSMHIFLEYTNIEIKIMHQIVHFHSVCYKNFSDVRFFLTVNILKTKYCMKFEI